MQAYNEVLARRGYVAAQLLLTHDDFQDRRRYLNLRNTLAALQDRKVLPIINENDTVSVDEIKFGDNDALGALVSNVVDASLTVVLSDVDGLYTANPRRDPTARRLPVVEEVTPEIEALADVFGLGRRRGRHGHQDPRRQDRHQRRREAGPGGRQAGLGRGDPAGRDRRHAVQADRRPPGPPQALDRPHPQGDGRGGGRRRGGPGADRAGQEPAAGGRGRLRRAASSRATRSWSGTATGGSPRA